MENFDKVIQLMVDDIWATYDTNKDGYLQKEEAQTFIQGVLDNMKCELKKDLFDEVFSKYDVNKDGKLSKEEMANFLKECVFKQKGEYEDSSDDEEIEEAKDGPQEAPPISKPIKQPQEDMKIANQTPVVEFDTHIELEVKQGGLFGFAKPDLVKPTGGPFGSGF